MKSYSFQLLFFNNYKQFDIYGYIKPLIYPKQLIIIYV